MLIAHRSRLETPSHSFDSETNGALACHRIPNRSGALHDIELHEIGKERKGKGENAVRACLSVSGYRLCVVKRRPGVLNTNRAPLVGAKRHALKGHVQLRPVSWDECTFHFSPRACK